MKRIMMFGLTALISLMLPFGSQAQNPYLPLWEYIPDGEPYVFEDPDCPGKYRVYVYGSHDSLITEYCGREQVVWSAPVEDLSAWRYDGIIFKSAQDANGRDFRPGGVGDVLYAPDVALKVLPDGRKEYYLYPNNQEGGRNPQVAVSDRPDGPFRVINWNKDNPAVCDGCLAFDPAVFVDDDGRVYGYWGFESSNGAELDPNTMASVKPGTTVVTDMISSAKQPGEFRFFEASSIRKIEDKYVFIYSRTTAEGEFGLPAVNYTLAYAYGDSPLGPFKYGGTLIDCRGRDVDDNGKPVCTANPYGNTHGSILEINGQWWVFYHRQTGTDEYSRQAMVSPITVKVEKGKGGKVEISEGEYNSEGFATCGLNPLNKTAAGIACYLTNPKGIGQSYPNFIFTGSYVKPTRLDTDSYQGPFNNKQTYCPVVNNTSGSVVGYKYFNFDYFKGAVKAVLDINFKPESNGTIYILAGGPKESRGGKVLGKLDIDTAVFKNQTKVSVPVELQGLTGKQPLFFVFKSSVEDKSICELYDFQFKLTEDSFLKTRKQCMLEQYYGGVTKEFKLDSPDMLFVKALCEGKADEVVALFREKKLFWDEAPVIDTPYERFEGLDGIRRFAQGFVPRFNATSVTFTPVFQTIGGGRVALEGVFKFVVDGEIEEVPMFVVVDLRTPKLLEEVRMYTNYSFVPGLTPYRKPIFKSAHYEMGDPGLLTGGMRAYYEALHHAPRCDADKIHASFADKCIVGGYEPWGAKLRSEEAMSREAHSFGRGLSTYIPECVGMRYETIIDDGKTCVIEWQHIVSREGQNRLGRVCMSGCSAYTRNEEGYLCAVRICDYAGHEREIDWTKTPISEAEAKAINFVEEFPAGCGFKPQD